jgi:hypothetical protein
MYRVLYNLFRYEISHAYVHWSFFHQKRNPYNIFLMSPSWYCVIYNYVYVINFYTSLRSRSTQRVFYKTHRSHIRRLRLLHCLITKRLGALQGHHNFYTRFLTIVLKFKKLNAQTDTQERTKIMAMLKIFILSCFPSQKANHYMHILPYSLCVSCWNSWPIFTIYMTSYFWRQRRFQFPTICNNNMVDKLIC